MRQAPIDSGTIMPVSYPIPDDGPAGQLLAAMGRHPFRPAHVHFMISAPGYRTLVTHLFFEGDEYLEKRCGFWRQAVSRCSSRAEGRHQHRRI